MTLVWCNCNILKVIFPSLKHHQNPIIVESSHPLCLWPCIHPPHLIKRIHDPSSFHFIHCKFQVFLWTQMDTFTDKKGLSWSPRLICWQHFCFRCKVWYSVALCIHIKVKQLFLTFDILQPTVLRESYCLCDPRWRTQGRTCIKKKVGTSFASPWAISFESLVIVNSSLRVLFPRCQWCSCDDCLSVAFAGKSEWRQCLWPNFLVEDAISHLSSRWFVTLNESQACWYLSLPCNKSLRHCHWFVMALLIRHCGMLSTPFSTSPCIGVPDKSDAVTNPVQAFVCTSAALSLLKPIHCAGERLRLVMQVKGINPDKSLGCVALSESLSMNLKREPKSAKVSFVSHPAFTIFMRTHMIKRIIWRCWWSTA